MVRSIPNAFHHDPKVVERQHAAAEASEALLLIRWATQGLKDVERIALMLEMFPDRSDVEAGIELGINSQSMWAIRQRAHAKCRRKLFLLGITSATQVFSETRGPVLDQVPELV